MAITTVDQLIAGMQYPSEFVKAATPTLVAGRPHSLFYLAGIPGAAVAPTPGLAGEALTTYAGQLQFSNPASGNSYLARLSACCTIPGQLILCDRLWQNSGFTITSTGSQTINSVAFPARDQDGSTNGNGVILGVEISGATGSGTPTITVGYTNSANAGSHSATNVVPTVASSAVGAFYPVGLQAGDVGVRSVQTLTLSNSWSSGVMHLVAYRILARLDLSAANVSNSLDAVTGGMPRMHDNSVPFLLLVPSAVTASNVSGHMIVSQG
jgi:hypothetical protein